MAQLPGPGLDSPWLGIMLFSMPNFKLKSEPAVRRRTCDTTEANLKDPGTVVPGCFPNGQACQWITS
jgi:hypothetical protein